MDVSIVVTDCDKDNKEKKHDTKNFKIPFRKRNRGCCQTLEKISMAMEKQQI